MEIKIVGEDGQIADESHKEMPQAGSLDVGMSFDVINVAQLLDIGLGEIPKNEDKINTLISWAKTQIDDPSIMNIKIALRNLESRVGSPGLAEERITKMHRFAYLELEEMKLKREKEAIYVNNR